MPGGARALIAQAGLGPLILPRSESERDKEWRHKEGEPRAEADTEADTKRASARARARVCVDIPGSERVCGHTRERTQSPAAVRRARAESLV